MIYAMQGCTGAGPAIKIGRAKNPKSRLEAFKTASPHGIKLLASMDWSDEMEQLIHGAFADLRASGEWFHPDDYMRSFVATMMCHHGASDEEKYTVCMRILVDRFLKRPCSGKCQAPDKRYFWNGKAFVLSEAWP